MLKQITQKYYEKEFQLGPEDVQDLIEAARQTLAESLADLSRSLVQETSFEERKNAAHALKGNLLNMGLAEQAGQALAIEKAVADDIDSARTQFDTLRAELQNF